MRPSNLEASLFGEICLLEIGAFGDTKARDVHNAGKFVSKFLSTKLIERKCANNFSYTVDVWSHGSPREIVFFTCLFTWLLST